MEYPFEHLQSPIHCCDTLIYCKGIFNPLLSEAEFQAQYKNIPKRNFEKLQNSIGCLLKKETFTQKFIHFATGFLVHVPNKELTLQGQKIKGLILTAAHVHTNPFLDDINEDIFFSLCPDVNTQLNNYTIYKATRMFEFEPFPGKSFVDPLTKNPYIMPNDIDIFALLDGSIVIQNNEGNKLDFLKYKPLDHLYQAPDKSCFVIGYVGSLMTNLALIAPILQKDSTLKSKIQTKIDFHAKNFAPGELLSKNSTCGCVSSSTWPGMSGGPLIFLSENKKKEEKFYFAGLYNGSGAAIFQSWIGKILFALNGHLVNFEKEDKPTRPCDTQKGNLFLVKTLNDFCSTLRQIKNRPFGLFSHDCSNFARNVLAISESCDFDISHNLVLCGGDRFDLIMKGISKLELYRREKKAIDLNNNPQKKIHTLRTSSSNRIKIESVFNMKPYVVQDPVLWAQTLDSKVQSFSRQLTMIDIGGLMVLCDKYLNNHGGIDEKQKFQDVSKKFDLIFEEINKALI